MKKILSVFVCFAFMLIGGFTLTACGEEGTPVSINEFQTFMEQDEITTNFEGFKLDAVYEDGTMNAVVVYSEHELNFAIEIASDDSGTVKAYYDGDYFYTDLGGTNKYFIPAASIQDEMDNLEAVLRYQENLPGSILESLEEISAIDNFSLRKIEEENKITFTATVKEGIYTDTINIIYIDNEIYEINETISSRLGVSYSQKIVAYKGAVDFPNFSTYKDADAPKDGFVNLSTIESYLNGKQVFTTKGFVWETIEDEKITTAYVDFENNLVKVESEDEKFYLKDGNLYYQKGADKVYTKLDEITSDSQLYEIKTKLSKYLNEEGVTFLTWNSRVYSGNSKTYQKSSDNRAVIFSMGVSGNGQDCSFIGGIEVEYELGEMKVLSSSFEKVFAGNRHSYITDTLTPLDEQIVMPDFSDFVVVA